MTLDSRGLAAVVVRTAFALGVPLALALAKSPAASARPVATPVVADTQRVTIKVTGMFCESCEASVRTMLKRTPGVFAATVDAKRGEVVVAYDPAKTTPQALVDVINRLGYKATLPAATKTEAAD
jgi:copper chaperone CopZ